MSALAQLLDKPATPVNYIATAVSTMARSPRNGSSSSSISRSSAGHHGGPIDYNDLDPDDLEYARPNYKKKSPISLSLGGSSSRRSTSSLSTTTLSSSSIVSTSSAGNFRLGRDLPVTKPRRFSKMEIAGSSPGSRLSLKATSLPQPASLSGVQQYEHQKRALELMEKRFKLVPVVSSTGFVPKLESESVEVSVKEESPVSVSVEGAGRKTVRVRKQRHSVPSSLGKGKEELILGLNEADASSPSDVDFDPDSNENGEVDSVVESSFDTLMKTSACDRTGPVSRDSSVGADARLSPRRKPPCSKTLNKCKNKIKRPLNAFMVWSKLHRRKIMDMDPTIHHSLISKHLGAGWKALSESDRKPFYEEAKKLSELHTQIYPDYKYQPRKRSKNSLDQEASGSGDSLVNVHSISSSSDVTKTYGDVSKTVETDSFSSRNPNAPFVRYTIGTIGCLPRRNVEGCLDLSMKRSNASYSDSEESVDSSAGASQPLNMSTKSMTKSSEDDQGLKSWSKMYEDSDESDEERLVIDEKDA